MNMQTEVDKLAGQHARTGLLSTAIDKQGLGHHLSNIYHSFSGDE